MFFALILACSVVDSNRCVLLQDTRGPYDTAQQCESRLKELLSNSEFKGAISDALDSPTVFAGRCREIEDNGHNI